MDTISSAQTVIKLLWTGGWDSTYRLVELSRMDVTVQPIYGCDGKRDSMEIEKRIRCITSRQIGVCKDMLSLRASSQTGVAIPPAPWNQVTITTRNRNVSPLCRAIVDTFLL